MKKSLFYILILLNSLSLLAQDDANNTRETIYRGMPTLSSNPTSGTGVGATGVMIYYADEDSSPSQALVLAQYTNTDSYSVFAVNKMFFSHDKWQSNTFGGILYNNSNYAIPGEFFPVLPPSINPDDGIAYNVTIYVLIQQFLYSLEKNFYIGGQFYYVDQQFYANNVAGQIFLNEKGIENSKRAGYGVTFQYDSRRVSEKFYAYDSSFIDLTVSQFPEFLGIDQAYANAILNARKYIRGFKSDDVFAMQLYGQYSSEKTPDGALAGLGARNVLRGFAIGQYKTRNMLAAQGEYRYRITSTSFRLAAFGGYANMSGGSYGNGAGNDREEDNGDYYSGGLGVHYILQKKQNLDYRVNVAYTNKKETSIYASINQAF